MSTDRGDLAVKGGLARCLLKRRAVCKELNLLPATEIEDIRKRQIRRGTVSGPLDNLLKIERVSMLNKAIRELPLEWRRIIVKRFTHRKTLREVSKEMGLSVGKIHILEMRALERLRDLILTDERWNAYISIKRRGTAVEFRITDE